MHRAVRVIFLLKSSIAATPYHRKIKSYPSSVEKNFFTSLLGESELKLWSVLSSGSTYFSCWHYGLCINNWTQGARVSLSWQAAFTPKIKKKFTLVQCFNDSESISYKTENLQNKDSKRKSLWAYMQATHLRGAETCMQINLTAWDKIAYLQNVLGVLKRTISEDF